MKISQSFRISLDKIKIISESKNAEFICKYQISKQIAFKKYVNLRFRFPFPIFAKKILDINFRVLIIIV